MKVLLNGIGCTVSGSRYVMEEFVISCPSDIKLTVYSPNEITMNRQENVHVIRVSHFFFGKKFRIFYEIYINLIILLKGYDIAINLSNYGICINKKQLMYLHNAQILNLDNRSLAWMIKRRMLNTFLRRGIKIFVQTDHLFNQLKTYCHHYKITLPVIERLYPMPVLTKYRTVSKSYNFELFYPSSDFPHKRTELALMGALKANSIEEAVGLVITKKSQAKFKAILSTGVISHSEVLGHMSVADALLFTSEFESLGLPLLEALYFELPAVLPDLPYAREIYGNAAVYFRNPEIEDVATAIRELYINYAEYKLNAIHRKQEEWEKRKSWSEQWHQILKIMSKD